MDVEKEEEDEEALSLCDLPNHEEENQLLFSRKESPKPFNIIDSQEEEEEFNFFSSWDDHSNISKDTCIADEVFFQGQILPLRQSVTSESGLIARFQSETRTTRSTSKCISRSETMDHYCSNSVGFTSVSSSSSSINSYHSSSSGSCTSSTITEVGSWSWPRHKIRNHFQDSQPSPKPQIRSSNIKNGINCNNSNRKSTLWSIFRVGLVATPEIAIQDLKFRTKSTKIKADEKEQIKRKQKFLDKKGLFVFFSSCKRSSSEVSGPIPSRLAAEMLSREVLV
ncbi:hypothetical protein ACH5RR_013998 [Cinchona calisaya]|uniref:Uncharacterized protein n=1 Tax=Cinchona calisaya TaxID=153742 RepID=A0ABD3A3Z2_9GENT